MGMFHPRTKEAVRADFALEKQLARRAAANPDDAMAIIKLCRLYARDDRPSMALDRLSEAVVQTSNEVRIHYFACETLLDIGAFDMALRQATIGLKLEEHAGLKALRARASRLLAEDHALGVDPALKRAYITAFDHLTQGRPAAAADLFEQVVATAPHYYPAWIGLRGALETKGDRAEVAALADRWLAASPASAPIVRIVMARRLHAGLLFNRRKSLPLLPMREAMAETGSLEALNAAASGFLPLDPGGQDVTLDPVISQRSDGGDRIVLQYQTPEVFLAGIDNAALIGRGAVVDAGGVMVREMHGPNLEKYGLLEDGDQVTFHPVGMRARLVGVKVYDTAAMLMAGASDLSFGDWMLIYLPRLAIARASGLRSPVVVSANSPPAFLEFLRQLGVRDEDIIRHDPHGVSLFRKLYVPSWPLRDYMRPMSGLFEVYRQLALPRSDGPGRRIYLSREKVSQRRLVNEAEVRATVERHGFEVVHPQDLSLRQTRELLADADYVAAPYGSALLNLAMAGRKPKVIVLSPPMKPGFRRQAALWLGSIGLQLAYVFGQQVGHSGDIGAKDIDWSVSLADVERVLTMVLA